MRLSLKKTAFVYKFKFKTACVQLFAQAVDNFKLKVIHKLYY